VPQIEVGFDIDANGILHVSAKDLGTGKSQKITITASSGLSKEEVEKMRKEAEAHAEEDQKLREQVELKNRSDARVYETEKLMKEHKDLISDDQRKKLEDALAKVKDALKPENFDAMKTAEEQLTEVWHAVSSDIYSKAREKSAPGAAPGGPALSPKQRRSRPSLLAARKATSSTRISRWWTTTRRSKAVVAPHFFCSGAL